ncbi:matrixin family metalloprotease [Pseudarthrobacter sp. H2]|uniref:matrixin family metalloprotease n=1 Tax=Pseudarthrobacter sp. H2 TaxID=3418415 RepID=UPI003CEFE49A
MAAVLIAGAAFLAAGVVYGDPRFGGLFEVHRGTGPDGRPTASGQAGQASAGQGGRVPGGTAAGSRTDAPPPGLEEQDEPLGTPRKPAAVSNSYKFLATNEDGSPVGYSPCRPLHYVVNAGLAPAGAGRLVENAITTVSRATGITFIDDGATAEAPAQSRSPYQKDAYGDRWAPLLIAWTTPEQAPQLKGPVIGTGGSTHFSFGDGPKSFVTGSLELDSPQITEELRRPDGAAYATAVILHELGHVMGLEHVDDPSQLMYPEIGAPDGLAAGDLNGLQALGRAACRKDL